MNLPDDLQEMCDHATATWPRNWFNNFGSSAFFHVVGLREYIDELYGPLNPSVVANKLIQHKDDVPAQIKHKWIADIHETNLQDVDVKTCLVDGNFNNLTVANIKNSYTGTPVTFPAALLTLLAATIFAKTHNDSQGYKRYQIRFAGYYILGFEEVYPNLTLSQKATLAEGTQQTATTSYECFHQMAKGQPVTKPLADRAADTLTDMTYRDGHPIPRLEVKPYQLRTDIGEIKKPARTERTYLQFKD